MRAKKLKWENEKKQVVEIAQRIEKLGLTAGSSGNVSIRLTQDDHEHLIAITPTGKRADKMEAKDIAVINFDVEPMDEGPIPSSESLLHVKIYQTRPDVGAVIHTHPIFASVAAVANLEIPPFIDEVVLSIGGPIKVSEYAFPSSQELADNVCEALGNRAAALIKNHGAVGVGKDLEKALEACILTERVATIFVHASLFGEIGSLPMELLEAEKNIYEMRRTLK